MLQSKKLSGFKHLNHGFSTKVLGDMNIRKKRGRKALARLLAKSAEQIVAFEQNHGTNVFWVKEQTSLGIIPGVDGGLTKTRQLFLGVNTADCVPILFFDPLTKIVGAIHAGWRGILHGIVMSTLRAYRQRGTSPASLIAVIGPHIMGCCYTITHDRTRLFEDAFPGLKYMLYKENDLCHLELAVPIIDALVQEGVKLANIEWLLCCTSCQKDRFFSYRRDKPKQLKEMVAFIGLDDEKT